ncbi:hypothetical protein NFX46_03610 [Streptomyces phaeoluteigriseus]|uniref:VWA domain-containing protein n=1 Tax=Streptomyces phaeoluteigriseus TaxID=114686 RepID=A0ABY4Z1U1_9ACTN|nr:hypothetical protein [Streptomyces phaeoluteigriseus]USQ82936.1 hypothetical protein NFX46_03610 [Streptomyces phaeoluteigriseus]
MTTAQKAVQKAAQQAVRRAAQKGAKRGARKTAHHTAHRTTRHATPHATPHTARETARHTTRLTAALGATALLLTGCVGLDGPERLSADCAVVVDGSGSGADSENGFRAKEKLKTTVPGFLADQKCRYVSYAPITAASTASSCQVGRMDLDPDADKRSERESLWLQTRALAQAGAEKMLDCARERQPGSDVLGGLERAAKVPRDGDGTYHVLVISDFDQSDPDFRLSKFELETPAQRDEAVDALVAVRGVPELPDTTVHRVGFAMRGGRTTPERVEQMGQFWQQVLEKEVKVGVDDGYGA